jgi:hypothetical protein
MRPIKVILCNSDQNISDGMKNDKPSDESENDEDD